MAAEPVVPIAVARAAFLRLMIPQLEAGGFAELAARYAVELARLDLAAEAACEVRETLS